MGFVQGAGPSDYDSDFLEISIIVPATSTTPPQRNIRSSHTTTQSNSHVSLAMKTIKIPNMKVKITTFVVLDMITTVFFTIDLLLRLISCPCVFRYFTSIINIADAAALISTYIHMLIQCLSKHHRYEEEWVDVLEYMQMLRSLRLFRLISNVRAGRVLAYTVRSNAKDLLILIMFLIAGMCTFASVFYIAEESVMDIPHSWYWAVVTMTTVGYGDITPQTAIGRLLSCICAVSGVVMFAMTVPIFANHFITLYQYIGAESTVKKELKQKKLQSVNIVTTECEAKCQKY